MAQTKTTLLLHGAIAGDLVSRDTLVAHMSPLLLLQANLRWPRTVWSVCEPEDLVQDMWLRVLERLGQFKAAGDRPMAGFCSFLGKILGNLINDRLRDHVRARALVAGGSSSVLHGVADSTNGAVTRAIRGEAVQQVFAALAEMGATNREVFVMRAMEGRSFRAIAEAMKVDGIELNDEAAKQRYRRGLAWLRERLPATAFAEIEDE